MNLDCAFLPFDVPSPSFDVLCLISNEELLDRLKARVENERKLLMEILHLLREVEERKLHLEMGYPDLYTFAIQELGYSSGAAYRRISAMSLLKTLPEVAPRLESGELGLENASQAQSFFRKEDQRRKEQGEERLAVSEKREVVTALLGKSTREGQRVLMERSPEVMTPSEKLKPLSEQRTLVQFVASQELMEKLNELKALLAHQNFEGKIDALVEILADMALKKLKPKPKPNRSEPVGQEVSSQMGADRKDLDSESPAPGMMGDSPQSRYIPAVVRRAVRLRDQNGCTYRDPKTGRICGTKHGLQLDHIHPFSRGGVNTIENLTLRCGSHNRYRAERMGLGRGVSQE